MYIFLSCFCLYLNWTHPGSWRTGRTLRGISMHLGKGQGAWCLQRVFLQVRRIRSRATTHKEIDQSNIAFAGTARLNSNLCVHYCCAATRHFEHNLCHNLNNFATPTLWHVKRAWCVPLVLGTRSQATHRSDVPIDSVKRGHSDEHALHMSHVVHTMPTKQP